MIPVIFIIITIIFIYIIINSSGVVNSVVK